jgi:hypothetical protein
MTPSSGCNLIEWIEYNIILGFDQIYITDDCSIDQTNLMAILTYYESINITTIIKSYTDYSECKSYRPNEGLTYKKMLFGLKAKENCEWITNIDYDEYITFYDIHINNINNYLTTFPYPFIRMPWWVYGNNGFEIKPRKLIIEAYYQSSMEYGPKYIKTIAQTNYFKSFHSPHIPKLYDSDVNNPMKIINHHTRKIPSVIPRNTSLNNKYWVNGPHQEEMKLINIEKITKKKTLLYSNIIFDNNTNLYDDNNSNNLILMYIPNTEIFIKHYKYLSYEEYISQRAKTYTLPNGRKNYWSVNPRLHWETGNNTKYKSIYKIKYDNYTRYNITYNEIETNIADTFTDKMITLLKIALKHRLNDMKFNNNNNIYNILKRDCYFIN